MILAILLGPAPAFLVMASVLTVQALFFADGGLLALGANIFNLGVFPCFVAYPLVFVPLVGRTPSRGRLVLASVLASVVGLELGAAGVVVETVASGVSELPFTSFLLLMLPIHAAIGVVEGVITAAVVSFVTGAQPDLLPGAAGNGNSPRVRSRVLIGVAAAAVVFGGLVSWFASTRPDGLEWAIGKMTGSGEVRSHPGPVHSVLEDWQKRLALLPNYDFPAHQQEPEAPGKGRTDPGASVSGLVGGLITLLIAGIAGIVLRRRGGSAPAR